MYRLHLDFAEKKNLIYTGGGDESLSERFEKIKRGSISQIMSNEQAGQLNDEGWVLYHYYINDEETDEDTYFHEVFTRLDSNNPFVRIAYDGIHQVFFEYMDGYIYTEEIRTIPYMTASKAKEKLSSGEKIEKLSEYYDKEDDDDILKGDYETLTNAFIANGYDVDKYGLDGFYVEVAASDGYVNVREGCGMEYPIVMKYDNGYQLYIGECHVDEKGILCHR